MIGLLRFVFAILVWPFTSQARLHAEIAVLRQQVIVLQRKSRGRVRLSNADRWFFVQLYRMFPSILQGAPTSSVRRRWFAGIEQGFARRSRGGKAWLSARRQSVFSRIAVSRSRRFALAEPLSRLRLCKTFPKQAWSLRRRVLPESDS